MSKILFISNGHGEDTIACSVIERLKEKIPADNILAFPLVGTGGAYEKAGVRVAAPLRQMPSGGMVPEDYAKNLWTDLWSGLGALTLQQAKVLGNLGKEIDLSVAVGDSYPVIMAGLFAKAPVVFVGTAKSSWFDAYSSLETGIFKKYCKKVFPRDPVTAEDIKKQGVNAEWVGNAMMDSMPRYGERFGIPEENLVITLLPGSRDFAYTDFPYLVKAARQIQEATNQKISWPAPLAGSTEVENLAESVTDLGFYLEKYDNDKGVVGRIYDKNVEITLIRGYFGDAIDVCKIAIGQAGTGNEQAAGLGKPVISFDSEDRENLGWYRKRQKGLLGDALAIVKKDADAIAQKALEILNDKDLYNHMSQTGKERLGPPGGAGKMADGILAALEK